MTQSNPNDPVPAARTPRREQCFRIALIVLIGLAVIQAGCLGMRFRWWVWVTTTPIRFAGDMDRGFEWGRIASAEGVLNQYEKMQIEKPADQNWLDYGPLRLELMSLWAKWAAVHHPDIQKWSQQKSYELSSPVLGFTFASEIVAAIAAFLLVRLWAQRGFQNRISPDGLNCRDRGALLGIRERDSGQFFRGVLPGLAAAAVLWFNPATALDSYGWPTFDAWVIPFFLLAALAASAGWWFTVGIVLGVGTMLNGQLLGVIPVFAIWAAVTGPLGKTGSGVARRLGLPASIQLAFDFIADLFAGAASLVGGALVAIAVVASPWLLSSIPVEKLATARAVQSHAGAQPWQVPMMTFAIARKANIGVIVWVTGIALLAAGLPWLRRWTSTKPGWPGKVRVVVEHPWFWPAVGGLTAFFWTLWPWLRAVNRPQFGTGLLCAIAVMALVSVVRPGWSLIKPVLITTAASLLLCMSLFNASTAWWDCGVRFVGGADPARFVNEQDKPDNVARLLTDDDFHWSPNKPDEPVMTLTRGELLHVWPRQNRVVGISELLRFFAEAGVLIAAIGLGIQARRRDARILIALVTPWVWYYCFTPQVQERYLVFASALTCICAGVSSGMTLLGMLLSVIATLSVLHVMLISAGYTLTGNFKRNFGTVYPSLFDADGPNVRSLADHAFPELAWAVILISLIFLYFTLAFRGTILATIRGWSAWWDRRKSSGSVANGVGIGTVPAMAVPAEVVPAGVVAVPVMSV